MKECHGDRTLVPFRYQGQYEDIETGLYYNRFRYYSPQMGMYISSDPIGLAGNNPTLYGYVEDVNILMDELGLKQQKYEILERYCCTNEAEQIRDGIIHHKHKGQPTWIAEKGRVDARKLGKPRNYTHVITIRCKPGTIEWMKKQGFELKPSNEPGRYAIPYDRIEEFNSKVDSVEVSRIRCKK